ncbi:MAG: hypothetical protein KGH72_02800 [Candidatus Micrarchaeota archaeon]|nr:hypothetical protein [Candidatus Micrarchaeota archaeon]
MEGVLGAIRSRFDVETGRTASVAPLQDWGIGGKMEDYIASILHAGLNLLVVSESAGICRGFIARASGLLPRYDITAILTADGKATNLPIMVRGIFVDHTRAGRGRALLRAIELQPVRIASEIELDNNNALFEYAARGGSFIAPLRGGCDAEAVPITLAARGVKMDYLNMLDVVAYIHMAYDMPILDVYEYLWLSRAETDDGRPINRADAFETVKIAENGGFIASSSKLGLYGPHRRAGK